MYRYLQEQVRILTDGLENENELEKIYDYAKTQIAWISHERLIHLLVTLFFATLLLVSLFAALFFEKLVIGILFIILAITVVFYVVHYFRLENGIQRLYSISNQIYGKIRQNALNKANLRDRSIDD